MSVRQLQCAQGVAYSGSPVDVVQKSESDPVDVLQVEGTGDCGLGCRTFSPSSDDHTLIHMHHDVHSLLSAAWGVTVCRSSLPFARECRLGVWFGFVGAALLPAVGTCVVLAFGAMPGR